LISNSSAGSKRAAESADAEPVQRRKSSPPSPPDKTKNQTKEEELCGKLLKKTPTRRYPMFKPANLSGFQNAAGSHVFT
jgi:hypothetical protein